MTGFVYAIDGGDAVKIGWATNPVRRLSELNVGSPRRHTLIGFKVATKFDERRIHSECSQHRIRGEWFLKDGAVLDFITGLQKYEPAADRVKNAASGCSALANFLTSSDLTERDFASKLGVTQQAVNTWVRGSRTPRIGQMQKIFEATNGAVTPNDFLQLPFRGEASASGTQQAQASAEASEKVSAP
jgi:DNA-binding transcriptional regulator YdaS (Cro superfamily)